MSVALQMQSSRFVDRKVVFFNQLPALLQTIKVYTVEIKQQWLALQIMQGVASCEAGLDQLYSRAQLQTVQQKHQNLLRYYRDLQEEVIDYSEQTIFPYQQAHCEFVEEALYEVIELCEKIVYKSIQLLHLPVSNASSAANAESKPVLQPEDSEARSNILLPDQDRVTEKNPLDVALATITEAPESIAGWLQPTGEQTPASHSTSAKSRLAMLFSWLGFSLEDCVWVRM